MKLKTVPKPLSIPFAPPQILPQDIRAVVEVLRSGWITTGPRVKAFEKALKEYTAAAGAVCVSSGTAALTIILKALGIGPGDEVITSPFTYTASASCIDHVGARIRFVDVDPGSFHLSPTALAKAVTSRTKAVIAVDYAGLPCDYDALRKALRLRSHLWKPRRNTLQTHFRHAALVGDAAHALGAAYRRVPIGAVADFTAFSFHAVKNLTTGEGGALLFRKIPKLAAEALEKHLYLILMHGQSKDALAKLSGDWRYDIRFLGYKYNMTDIQAALGLSQLTRYDRMLAARKKLYERYCRNLQGHEAVMLPRWDPRRVTSAYHLFPIRVRGFDESRRDALIGHLRDAGIAANVHFVPLPMHTAYRVMGFDMGRFPNAYDIYRNLLTVPLHLALTLRDIDRISRSLLEGIRALTLRKE